MGLLNELWLFSFQYWHKVARHAVFISSMCVKGEHWENSCKGPNVKSLGESIPSGG